MCMTDIYDERYQLALDRIREIPKEHFGVPVLETYLSTKTGDSCRKGAALPMPRWIS